MDPKAIEQANKVLHVSERALIEADIDITPVQYSVLAIIAEGERAAPSDLARRMLVAPAVMTGLLDRLERRGYVERRHDPIDRRRTWIHITTTGRAVLTSATSALEAA